MKCESRDRYEPLETARWLTKQSNEQSNVGTLRDPNPAWVPKDE